MKSYYFGVFAFMLLFLSSCEVVGGIFKTGVWFGIIGVILVVWLLISVFGKGTKK